MDINTMDISPFSRNSSTFDPRSSKQTQEFLGENWPSSINHFRRGHTYGLTTLNVSFEEEVRSGEGLLTLGIVPRIHRVKRKTGGRECTKIRLPLTKKIFPRRCYCKIFERTFESCIDWKKKERSEETTNVIDFFFWKKISELLC